MRIGIVIMLLVGIAIAGFAGFIAVNQMASQDRELQTLREENKKIVPVKPVYVAARQLSYGQTLTLEDVTTFDWPENNLIEGSFLTEEDLFGNNEPEDRRIVLKSMDPGDVITVNRVTDKGQDAGLVSRLKTGTRAFTLSVNFVAGAAALLRPGDTVDVYWTGTGQDGGTVTRLLLDGIELLAIDQNTDENQRTGAARTITVAVDPATVGTIVQAQETGKLQVSLRGIGDDSKSDNTATVDSTDVLGTPTQAAKRRCVTRVRKGAEVIEQPIPCPNPQ